MLVCHRTQSLRSTHTASGSLFLGGLLSLWRAEEGRHVKKKSTSLCSLDFPSLSAFTDVQPGRRLKTFVLKVTSLHSWPLHVALRISWWSTDGDEACVSQLCLCISSFLCLSKEGMWENRANRSWDAESTFRNTSLALIHSLFMIPGLG